MERASTVLHDAVLDPGDAFEKERLERASADERAKLAAMEEARQRAERERLEQLEHKRRQSELSELKRLEETAKREAAVRRKSVAQDLAKSVSSEIRSRFVQGVDMVKHGRQGAPKKRRLFLDPRTDELYWGAVGAPAPKASAAKADKRFLISSDVLVKRGKTTNVFSRVAQG